MILLYNSRTKLTPNEIEKEIIIFVNPKPLFEKEGEKKMKKIAINL
jgi:hypothetical protein